MCGLAWGLVNFGFVLWLPVNLVGMGVDAAGVSALLARSAILAADLVLIPVQPSPFDVWASSEIVALINEARIFKPWLKAAFVVNRCIVRSVIGRESPPPNVVMICRSRSSGVRP